MIRQDKVEEHRLALSHDLVGNKSMWMRPTCWTISPFRTRRWSSYLGREVRERLVEVLETSHSQNMRWSSSSRRSPEVLRRQPRTRAPRKRGIRYLTTSPNGVASFALKASGRPQLGANSRGLAHAGEGIASSSPGGGIGVLTADACRSDVNLSDEVADLKTFESVMPSFPDRPRIPLTSPAARARTATTNTWRL